MEYKFGWLFISFKRIYLFTSTSSSASMLKSLSVHHQNLIQIKKLSKRKRMILNYHMIQLGSSNTLVVDWLLTLDAFNPLCSTRVSFNISFSWHFNQCFRLYSLVRWFVPLEQNILIWNKDYVHWHGGKYKPNKWQKEPFLNHVTLKYQNRFDLIFILH